MMLFPTAVYGVTHARLVMDNVEVTGLDVPPIIVENRVMVPARGVFERVGGRVEWDDSNRRVTVHYGSYIIVMTINDTVAWRNGEPIFMDVPPIIHNNRTLIPLRFPAEAFGFCVDWDSTGRTAIINTNGQTWAPGPGGEHANPPPTNNNPSSNSSSVHIQAQSHPTTSINALLTPSDTGMAAYAIVASSAISDVNHFLLADNRLVVDIYNAVSNIDGPFLAYGPVSGVRSSQFSVSPDVTRVVFDLIGSAGYNISLSYDRRVVTVAFAVNNIYVTPNFNTHSDSLLIRGDILPSVRMSASYPAYLAMYVDNATINSAGVFMQGGAFVSHYEIQQRADGIVYIRMFMRDVWPSFSLSHGTDYVSVSLHGGLNGIRYDTWSRELRISRDVIPGMNIAQVRHNDEYSLNRYTIYLPIAADGLGLGTLHVGDDYINSVTVQRNGFGNAKLVFETSRIVAITIHETATEYIIRVRQPQDVHPIIIVIDPGHGGRDPGAIHHGVVEKDVVLAISHMVAEHLSRHTDIRVYMTRSADEFVELSDRTELANQMADVFVSIHANAVENRPHVSGIETWFMPNSRDNSRGFTSMQLAQIVQRHMVNATGAVDRGIKDYYDFVVLRDLTMPAVLVEVGFLTNAAEAARLATTAHQQQLARAIYEGIIEVLSTYGSRG